MLNRKVVARRATSTALVAISIDASYTIVFWLVLERPHVWWKYFLIVGQLSAEAVAIAYFINQLRRVA